MIRYLMKRYALSRRGASDLIKASIANTISNLVLMLPVSLLFLLVSDLLRQSIPNSHLILYIVGMIVSIALIVITTFFQYNANFFATYKESAVRRITLAEKLRKLPLSFFNHKDLADLTSTILSDCATLETAFSHWIPEFFGAIASTCIIAINLFFFEWRLALAALWVLPVALLIVFLSKRVQNYFSNKQMEAKIVCADKIQEALETMRDLKANNAEEKYLATLNQSIDQVEKRAIKAELGTALFVVSAWLLLKFGIATVALVGSVLLVHQELSVLTFFMFLLVVSRIYEPMNGTLQNLAAINASQININRMAEIENCPVQSGEKEFNIKNYDIEFCHVSFSYAKNETVLKDVSFVAKQGQVTALVGPSGGGKSTVSKLISRFYDPDQGKILIGSENIATIDPESLLTAFSIVFQDVVLFNNTIMENIRIGNVHATDEEVLEAARLAQCDEFVLKLKDQYQTIIGENGCTLSGGERQRISIARALLKNAPIILLDEATASLDAENETLIQQALSRLIQNKTVLIIAHRMRTIENADQIILLKDGCIAESGTPKQLLEKNGLYAQMIAFQQQKQGWKI